MPWYRFWKKSGPMAGLAETYRHYDEVSEDALELDVENWADDMPGGHNTSYRVGYEKVDHPPVEWLRKKLEGVLALREKVDVDIHFYEAELIRIENGDKKEEST